jgi:hypothetical protein
MKHSHFIIFIVLVLFVSDILVAQKAQIPPQVQAALLKKIFSFDKALSMKTAIDITVIGGGNEILSALKNAGLNAVSGNTADGDVVYVGSESSATKASTTKAGILSVSGIPANAENGSVSIALGVEGGKPKIIINMVQLKAEGHELSADLLMLARIIQ